MKNLILVTITSRETNPENVLESFLHSNQHEQLFIPVVSKKDLALKREKDIQEYEQRLASGVYRDLGRDFNPDKEALHSIIGTKQYTEILIRKLKEMSLDEYMQQRYGQEYFFDEAANAYGYMGNN